jgi:predicted phosphodiesterase
MLAAIENVSSVSDNAIVVSIDVPQNDPEWIFWLHVTSDIHFDHQKCRRDVLSNHVEIAQEKKALWIDNGDFHCAMQGKYDKRSNLDSLRDEYKVGDYLSALKREAVSFLNPHANRLLVMGKGNHETSQMDKHGVDLTGEVVDTLRAANPNCFLHAGGYTTYITLKFKQANEVLSLCLWMMHGYGGGGPVTKDLIQLNRQLAYIDNADYLISGHTHDSWVVPFTRMMFNKRTGKPSRRFGYAVKVPTMKDEYGTGVGGWSTERGHPPKPLGSYLIGFKVVQHKGRRYISHKPLLLNEHDAPGRVLL